MRNTSLPPGAAPTPATCGPKKRAATLDITTNAVRPCVFGTLARIAYPGIFDLAHSTGKKIGESPSMLKSKPLCVYFQMYSPSTTRYLLRACWRPTWNSLRAPGLSGVVLTQGLTVDDMSALITGSVHPLLARIRFSLKGVSMMRAYEARSTVLVFLTL